jgi:photosystem II stability/assembly factor-like uncharacterized protein
MEPQDPEPWLDSPPEPARARRALALIAASLLAIGVTALAYLHPAMPGAGTRSRPPAAAAATVEYRIAGMDFVDSSTGWVAAALDSGVLEVIHTTDAGRQWSRELSNPIGGRSVYLRFFDRTEGIVALLGVQPQALRTSDGGRTWQPLHLLDAGADVTSLSFVDPLNGWELIRGDGGQKSALYRTADGGASWSSLDLSSLGSDQPYGVQFADQRMGWLDAASGGPYVYRSVDGGATWARVSLPAPSGGWPRTGQFFVSAQPTQGFGVVTTVVPFPPSTGRSGLGATVIWYPPLTVRTFDGGSPVSYQYATLTGDVSKGQPGLVQAPNQLQLGSLDGGENWTAIAPPAQPGAIGYSTVEGWWWIGSGAWSTSTDGGMTWTPYRNVGVPQPLQGSLQVLDPNHAWFAAMTGTRPVLESTADAGITWRMVLLPALVAG